MSWGLQDLSSWPGIKPVPPATEAWSLNHWSAGKVTVNSFLVIFVFEGITPVLLFTELRVGKAQVGKLEENSRRHRNCRHVYSPQDGAVSRHAVFFHGAPSRHSHRGFSGGAYIGHDAHVQCYKWSQMLHNHAKSLFTKCGVRARGHGSKRAWPLPYWLICSFSIFYPFRLSHLTIRAQSVSCDIPLS